ncbi:uncharacterized protein LOC131856105 isoform X2 [Cryptomeria japonica]|uniref:uncharacterized protein LOC131856105 isoform X2 n=1 Tax=Cryptomeria japonica TaxID=3369 RepID=UPI0027DA4B60|nr:uncharacterized protein LOC131856105 isoform X2 [Cryptomeria japonica]
MAPMLQHLFNLSPMLQDFLTRMRNMTRALHPLRRHRAHPHRQSSAEECCSCDDEEEEEKRSKTTHHKQQEIQQETFWKMFLEKFWGIWWKKDSELAGWALLQISSRIAYGDDFEIPRRCCDQECDFGGI